MQTLKLIAKVFIKRQLYPIESNLRITLPNISSMKPSNSSSSQNPLIQHSFTFIQRLRMRVSAWLYKTLLYFSPTDPDLMANLGNIEVLLGNYEKGVRLLGLSLDANPDQPLALFSQGIGLQNLGRLNKALECYDRAITLHPDFQEARDCSALLRRSNVGTSPHIQPLDDINRLVHARHGWFLANRYDFYLGSALIRYGEFSEAEHEFLASLLGPGDFVIEVGSNIGAHTIGLAKIVGASGQIFAIEPQPAIFRSLCANLALNSLFNVQPFACGCGSHRDTMTVVTAIDYSAATAHNSGGVSLSQTGDGIPVSVMPLDELVGDIPSLRLIKIDVEGMEREVLLGANGIIEKHRPLLYVENDRLEKSKALIELIMAAGYRLWWHIPFFYNPDNYFHVEENDYPNEASYNMFCQPREAVQPALSEGLIEINDPDFHPLGH